MRKAMFNGLIFLGAIALGCSSDDSGDEGSGGSNNGGTTASGGSNNSNGGNSNGGNSQGGQSTSNAGNTNGGGGSSNNAGGNAEPGCAFGDRLFGDDAPFNQRVDEMPLDAESDDIIAFLAANHQSGVLFQTDFSLTLLPADAQTPHMEFTPTGDHYSPDCDLAAPPVPEGGSLEGEDGYACESDGDCHLIAIDSDECKLYEMWRANISGGDFAGGCLAIWDMSQPYPETGHGDYCTSADAAGLPIAPLTFTADEVAAGAIEHAIRFIMPNSLIREDIFVRPGTHSTFATSGGPDTPPYAARMRLKADTDLSGLSAGAQIVATALQRYGMILADGGNVTFTAASDKTTEHSWDEVDFTAQDLKSLSWTDFEVVELGERITWSDGDCQRTPIE